MADTVLPQCAPWCDGHPDGSAVQRCLRLLADLHQAGSGARLSIFLQRSGADFPVVVAVEQVHPAAPGCVVRVDVPAAEVVRFLLGDRVRFGQGWVRLRVDGADEHGVISHPPTGVIEHRGRGDDDTGVALRLGADGMAALVACVATAAQRGWLPGWPGEPGGHSCPGPES